MSYPPVYFLRRKCGEAEIYVPLHPQLARKTNHTQSYGKTTFNRFPSSSHRKTYMLEPIFYLFNAPNNDLFILRYLSPQNLHRLYTHRRHTNSAYTEIAF